MPSLFFFDDNETWIISINAGHKIKLSVMLGMPCDDKLIIYDGDKNDKRINNQMARYC